MKEKQIVQVLEAIKAGCETSHEVEAFTGIDRRACSSYISELHKAGSIIRIRSNCWGYGTVQRGHRYAPGVAA